MGRHNRLALRRATGSPTPKTCACWEIARIRSTCNSNILSAVELSEPELTNHRSCSARCVSRSASYHIRTTCPLTVVISAIPSSHSYYNTIPHLLLRTLSECSASPLTLRGTRLFSVIPAISAELARCAGVVLTLLIKLVSGETQSWWMTVLAGEVMRGCVFLLSPDRAMSSVHIYAFQDLGNAKFIHNIW
jgi:hypothetical protein